jgi:hypothetical protein
VLQRLGASGARLEKGSSIQRDRGGAERAQVDSGRLEGSQVIGRDGNRGDRARVRRLHREGGDGRGGDWSGEEEDDEGALLDMIVRAGTTRRRGAPTRNDAAHDHCSPGRRSPRGLGVSTRPGQLQHVNSVGHLADEVKEEENGHSGTRGDHSQHVYSGTARCLIGCVRDSTGGKL